MENDINRTWWPARETEEGCGDGQSSWGGVGRVEGQMVTDDW